MTLYRIGIAQIKSEFAGPAPNVIGAAFCTAAKFEASQISEQEYCLACVA